MEGPTPVSALIHAATMVTAGVYMIARTHVLFDRSLPSRSPSLPSSEPLTAFFAATVGLVQHRHQARPRLLHHLPTRLHVPRLRRGGLLSAGVFHLLTHAFFKALLFLAAGSVIHGL